MGEQEDLIAQYENELAMQAQMQAANPMPYASQAFAPMQKQNLIEWELDFKPELDAIIQLVRCDILIKDKDGNEYWTRNPDKDKVFLNDLGVNDVIRTIVTIVNKGKALANYDLDEINARVKMLRNELRVLIYNNYELYGIDNEYKMNNYSMMVIAIGSIIEDVYRRAMNGETHRGLNEQRIVQQNEPLIQQSQYPMIGINQQNKPQGLKKLLPWNWTK